MLSEITILQLAKDNLQDYVELIEQNDFMYMAFKGRAKAFLQVLNKEELKYKFLSPVEAKRLLTIIDKMLGY